MMSAVNGSYAAPFGCRWITFSKQPDAPRVSNFTRAMCVRVAEAPRMVSEADCTGCKFWEPADKRPN